MTEQKWSENRILLAIHLSTSSERKADKFDNVRYLISNIGGIAEQMKCLAIVWTYFNTQIR